MIKFRIDTSTVGEVHFVLMINNRVLDVEKRYPQLYKKIKVSLRAGEKINISSKPVVIYKLKGRSVRKINRERYAIYSISSKTGLKKLLGYVEPPFNG